MNEHTIRVTHIGGPTALLEVMGVRLVTDPTFEPPGSECPTPVYTRYKTQGPAHRVRWPEPGRPMDIAFAADA